VFGAEVDGSVPNNTSDSSFDVSATLVFGLVCRRATLSIAVGGNADCEAALELEVEVVTVGDS